MWWGGSNFGCDCNENYVCGFGLGRSVLVLFVILLFFTSNECCNDSSSSSCF